MDVTIRWPDEDAREALRLGTIAVTGVEANDACDEAVFNPANLAEGIGRPPDAMFAARCAAYAISQTRTTSCLRQIPGIPRSTSRSSENTGRCASARIIARLPFKSTTVCIGFG